MLSSPGLLSSPGFVGSVGSVGTIVPPGLSPVDFSLTNLSAGIVSFDPSGYVIVALPLSSTDTSVPSGNLSLLASSILFLTSSFSVSVKLYLSTTSVFPGTVGFTLSASTSLVALPFKAFSAAINASFALSTSSWVASLFSSTFFASSNAWSYASFLSGSAFLYLSDSFVVSALSTSFWSSDLSTSSFCSTTLSAGIVSVDPSGYVIVTLPLSSTSTFVPSGNLSLLASSILFLTSSFSLSVKLSLSPTSVFSGIVGSISSAVVPFLSVMIIITCASSVVPSSKLIVTSIIYSLGLSVVGTSWPSLIVTVYLDLSSPSTTIAFVISSSVNSSPTFLNIGWVSFG